MYVNCKVKKNSDRHCLQKHDASLHVLTGAPPFLLLHAVWAVGAQWSKSLRRLTQSFYHSSRNLLLHQTLVQLRRFCLKSARSTQVLSLSIVLGMYLGPRASFKRLSPNHSLLLKGHPSMTSFSWLFGRSLPMTPKNLRNKMGIHNVLRARSRSGPQNI